MLPWIFLKAALETRNHSALAAYHKRPLQAPAMAFRYLLVSFVRACDLHRTNDFAKTVVAFEGGRFFVDGGAMETVS